MSTTKKNGMLFLEDPMEKEWKEHFFVLTGNKLYYTDLCKPDIDNEDEPDGGDSETSDKSNANQSKEVSLIYFILYHEITIM